MSVAVLIGVHDGVVLAADSASTLTLPAPPGVVLPPGLSSAFVANVYDNANKIFNLVKGLPIGCITFGSGNIGSASIGTLIKDLRKKLTESPEEMNFSADVYTMENVANILMEFLGNECEKLEPSAKLNTTIGLLLGGYSKPGDLGESWSVGIEKGIPQPPRRLRANHEPGLSWGGMTEVLQRMILGFSPALFPILAQVTQPPQNPTVLASQLAPVLTARLQAPLISAPMPIQDVIDLARFLVHSAIMYARFLPGPNVVGGPIEIAAITKHESFKWISRKHYYDQPLNKEPFHVVVDRCK
jgi:hypothetical protein